MRWDIIIPLILAVFFCLWLLFAMAGFHMAWLYAIVSTVVLFVVATGTFVAILTSMRN